MNELQSVTDIDEVIKYAEREAEGYHQTAGAFHTDEGVYLQEETRFQYKAILWENIHEWLEELKELRKKKRPHGKWEFIGENLFKCTHCGYVADGDYLRKWKVHTFNSEFPDACLKCGAYMSKEGEF